MMLPSRLDCPLSLKTPNMGNPGEDRYSPHGSGQLKLMRDEPEITLRDYCRMMITISDNMATDLLMEAVGIPNINTFLDRLGCPNTRTSVTMGRYHYRMTYQDDLPTNRANDVLQAEASAAGANDYKSVSYSDSLENNVAAPAEMGGIMKRMYEGTLVSSDASSEMLEMMKNARELRMIRPYSPVIVHRHPHPPPSPHHAHTPDRWLCDDHVAVDACLGGGLGHLVADGHLAAGCEGEDRGARA